MVDILLGALAVVTGSKKPAGAVGGQTGLKAGGLGVVVVSITVLLGDVLKDNAPVALNIDGTLDLGVINLRGAEVSLRSSPVGQIVGGRSLGGSGVVGVVKGILLVLGDVLNQVISRLLGHVRVLLQEDGVLADLVGDLVLGVLGVLQAEGKVGVKSTLGWGLGVTVSVGSGTVGSSSMGSKGSVGASSVGSCSVVGGSVSGGGRVGEGARGGSHDNHGCHGHHQGGYLEEKREENAN